MSAAELRCWNCGADLKAVPRPISRHEQCPDCFEALHCCRFCQHYRPAESSACEEDRADPPVIKENANFCDWFRPDGDAFSGDRTAKADTAKDRLQALFGADSDAGTDEPTAEEDETETGLSKEAAAKSRLDDLFK